ncbi:L-seryl-tRNA(Sec) selenium transferase [Arcobacter sp. FWKO B]|uniref:L-seryl-tRNA(Sec) selenium transferase n=1 Tax=Arcobacter sp. FWKO B TaxID=2593672 RepID=UPI0018A347DE|nr:L-seryl-tRNA(Sec) selenium transferase [Arcobacter sp. FWKO B]QOG11798.1 L-seryl-tRNA(Sec) selenium transferase [Arcobacter sp. FWKO B]
MNELLRQIPQVDKLLNNEYLAHLPSHLAKQIIQSQISRFRDKIIAGEIKVFELQDIINAILKEFDSLKLSSLKHVINATGITVHTNLGRSPISDDIYDNVKKIATRYSNLEYDMTQGKRGDRYHHLNKFSPYLFEDYEVLLVNNNAAAVFLILNTFSKNKQTIVSRAELVEIGGGFRIPEVMSNSSALLCEVGTTNKTRISDYEKAITDQSAILMKVHQSNFSIVGFTEEASLDEIVTLGKEKGLVSYYDLGSGILQKLNFSKDENTIQELCKKGLDIISFSTDKLIGSIQGGIILAKKELMSSLKQNQLLRMLRADKLTIAIVEESLKKYLFGEHNDIFTYKMLNEEPNNLKEKAQKLHSLVSSFIQSSVLQTTTFAGGGSMPNEQIISYGISLKVKNITNLEKYLRANSIIARIENECVILDVRTIFDDEFETIKEVIKGYK